MDQQTSFDAPQGGQQIPLDPLPAACPAPPPPVSSVFKWASADGLNIESVNFGKVH
jgi:hypothetical protein